MFIGRTQELRLLEACYEKPETQIVVLYGREGIGKTELVRRFIENKPFRYTFLEECSGKEQLSRLKQEWVGTEAVDHLQEWEDGIGKAARAENFKELFSGLAEERQEREVWIIDEFQHGIRTDNDFREALMTLSEYPGGFLVLISSSVNWVENDMVRSLGALALKITSFVKLREWGFLDLVARFPNFKLEDCIQTYAVTGGVPEYLVRWNGKKSFEENVTALFLRKNGWLYGEALRFLKAELRELSLYNTILAAMAAGATKLNDMKNYTGFGRAKLSVYLKNLIELDIVEKVFSYDAPGKENTKKGVYRIKDFYILFYYRYLFPKRAMLELADDMGILPNGQSVYQMIFPNGADELWGECYKRVCTEYLGLMNDHGRLPIHVVRSGGWFGKQGNIDYLAEDEDGRMLAAFFLWQEEPVDAYQYEDILQRLGEAGVAPEYTFLFAKRSFTEELITIAGREHIVLKALDEM